MGLYLSAQALSMINSYTLRTRARSLSFADEFPQEGVHRDDGGIYGFEGFQEFDQSLGFCIVGAVLADGFQERFGIGFEDGQFVRQSRVEYGIGIFLIGVDVFFFAPAHVTPDFHGRFGTAATELVVPDHTADDARIREFDTCKRKKVP